MKVQKLLQEHKTIKQQKAQVKSISSLSGIVKCGHCGGAMGVTYTKKKDRRYAYYHCIKDSKRPVSVCPLKRVPVGDIETLVVEQLNAIFRSPTIVSKTYFMARDIENQTIEKLQKEKRKLSNSFDKNRSEVMRLIDTNHKSDEEQMRLHSLNQIVVDDSAELSKLRDQLLKCESKRLTEKDVYETFGDMDYFWEHLFPLERNRIMNLMFEKVELQETGIDLEIKTHGLTSLITEVVNLGSEAVN